MWHGVQEGGERKITKKKSKNWLEKSQNNSNVFSC